MDNKGETGPELHRLLSLFPHKLVRPTQVAALEAIARMFAEGIRRLMKCRGVGVSPPCVGHCTLCRHPQ